MFNPQGSDLARSLLEFAEGKPITVCKTGTPFSRHDAPSALARYGANLFGVKGRNWDELAAWATGEAAEEIRKVAADPIGCRWWAVEADEPWTFLRWCFEWREYLEAAEAGREYISHLPVYQDATCSGLQHLSLLLRDHETGAKVNLVPHPRDRAVGVVHVARYPDPTFKGKEPEWTGTDGKPIPRKPGDIYTDVAASVRDALHHKRSRLAKQWREFLDKSGVARKLSKRPTMTMLYGSTERGRCGQIMDTVFGAEAESTFSQSDDFEEVGRAVGKAADYLEEFINDAIKQHAPRCYDLMQALEARAKALAKAGHHAEWAAPSGFPVRQREFKTETTRPNTALRRRRGRVETDKLDPEAAGRAIIANLIHSCDAAHLARTVCRWTEGGRGSLAVIHDCFATVAADADAMYQTVLWALVQTYLPDWLATWRAEWAKLCPEAAEGFPDSLSIAEILYCNEVFI